MEQLGVSAIHPTAPSFLSAVALFSAPVDLERAIGRMNSTWKVGAVPQWAEVDADAVNAVADGQATLPTGTLVHFTLEGVQVMLSGVDQQLEPPKGSLPEHSFYVAITLYTAPTEVSPGSQSGDADTSAASTVQGVPERTAEVDRRRNAVIAHIVLTQLAHALLSDEHAIGLFRPELGVVQPPHMLQQLAPLLTQGQIPLPLWVNIRTQSQESTVGRTLGLPLFGHLDLEIVESARSEEDVYAELANLAVYIISGDEYLLPGQTVGSVEGEQIGVTQSLSPLDQTPVIRIMY